MATEIVKTNRAPVLTLWAAVVAEREGHDRDAALSLGKALSGLNAQSKGRMIGIFGPPKKLHKGPPKKTGLGEDFWLTVCGRPIPAKNTPGGIRAVIKDKPIESDKVLTYLKRAFGDRLEEVRSAMELLAAAYEPEDLDDFAYGLYERFRPQILPGKRGWGQKGDLDLDLVRSLADEE